VQRFRVCLVPQLTDPFAAAMPRQGRGGRRRGEAVDLTAHIRGFAGAAGSAVSPVDFSRTTETGSETGSISFADSRITGN